MSTTRIAAALRRGGRQRGIEDLAAKLQQALRRPQLRQPAVVQEALGTQALALLATLNVECTSVDQLAEAAIEAFRQHPDHAVLTSFPGLADVTGARVLAEIGDDRARFADARALKAEAGAAPVTGASGCSISITHRKVKNDRLAAAGYLWAFVAAAHAEPAKQRYQRRRDHGDRHPAQRCATCSTGSSAACTTAWQPPALRPAKAFAHAALVSP
ncbi:transposase [Actinoplanes sp. NPDC051411]|uniref:transposase n=1 Tax=Actinoplanes sp. NPDC051411 TaxID=3155522 RepID=UPI003442C203